MCMQAKITGFCRKSSGKSPLFWTLTVVAKVLKQSQSISPTKATEHTRRPTVITTNADSGVVNSRNNFSDTPVLDDNLLIPRRRSTIKSKSSTSQTSATEEDNIGFKHYAKLGLSTTKTYNITSKMISADDPIIRDGSTVNQAHPVLTVVNCGECQSRIEFMTRDSPKSHKNSFTRISISSTVKLICSAQTAICSSIHLMIITVTF